MKRRLLAILLTLALLAGILPAGVLAEDDLVTVDGLTYAVYSDHVVLTGCESQRTGTVTVPEEIEGLPVTEVGEDAFSLCQSLEAVELPDSVTEIGKRAFSGCQALREVRLPKGLTVLREYLFMSCQSLETFTIPEGITSVERMVFSYCTSLKQVTFPESLETFAGDCFRRCTALTEFVGSTSGQGAKVVDGLLMSPDKKMVWAFPPNHPAERVTVPAGVEEIDASAFAECANLAAVELPDSVREIGWNAFQYCTSLKSIRLPEGITTLGCRTFYSCTALETVILPETLTTIETSAFSECPAMKQITIPASVTMMDNCGLSGAELVIYGYENSAAQRYAGIHGVRFVNLGPASGEYEYIYLPEERLQYEIVNGQAVITGAEFSAAYNAIEIPTEIGGCPVTEIASMAFFWTDGLESVTVPDSVTRIGDHAFAECYNLREVLLPAHLTELPGAIFLNCWNLQAVNLPEGLTTVGGSAFAGCKSLAIVILPEMVTELGGSAFLDCTALEEIYLPEGLSTIGSMAFAGCEALKELYVPSTVTTMEEKAFGFSSRYAPYGDCTIYAYAGSDAVRYARTHEVELMLMAFEDDDEAGTWTWASDAIYNCVGAGLINGYPGNLFLPDKDLSRIELVTILYRLYRELGGEFYNEWPAHPFTDAPGDWYQEALTWAYNEKIVNGKTDTTYAPDAPILRQEMAAILYRFLTTYYEMDPVTSNHLDQYRDADQVDAYARTAMEFCISEGIIGGVGGGRLAPRETATRGQIACVMDRAFIQ